MTVDTLSIPSRLLDIKTIYHEPAVLGYARGQEIAASGKRAAISCPRAHRGGVALEHARLARQRRLGRRLAQDQARGVGARRAQDDACSVEWPEWRFYCVVGRKWVCNELQLLRM